jgi:hypothetical protein
VKLNYIEPTRVVHGPYFTRKAVNFELAPFHFSIAMDGGIT